MKTKYVAILVLLISGATAIVFFLIGAGVAGYFAVKAAAKVPTFNGVKLEDDFTTDGFAVTGATLVCGVKGLLGTTPDRVVIEYTDPESKKQLGSKTVELKTNDRGGKYLEVEVPSFDNLVIVHIKRSR